MGELRTKQEAGNNHTTRTPVLDATQPTCQLHRDSDAAVWVGQLLTWPQYRAALNADLLEECWVACTLSRISYTGDINLQSLFAHMRAATQSHVARSCQSRTVRGIFRSQRETYIDMHTFTVENITKGQITSAIARQHYY
jgi:hypothetical protein